LPHCKVVGAASSDANLPAVAILHGFFRGVRRTGLRSAVAVAEADARAAPIAVDEDDSSTF
jgi:hypothetical protein